MFGDVEIGLRIGRIGLRLVAQRPVGEQALRDEHGVDLAALPITPADVAAIQKLVEAGSINDKLARQVFDGVLAGEGTPDDVVHSVSPTTTRAGITPQP